MLPLAAGRVLLEALPPAFRLMCPQGMTCYDLRIDEGGPGRGVGLAKPASRFVDLFDRRIHQRSGGSLD